MTEKLLTGTLSLNTNKTQNIAKCCKVPFVSRGPIYNLADFSFKKNKGYGKRVKMVPNFLIHQDKKYITRKLNVFASFSKYLQNDMLPVMDNISAFVFDLLSI